MTKDKVIELRPMDVSKKRSYQSEPPQSKSSDTDFSEDRLAEDFAKQHEWEIKYEPDRAAWYFWTGCCWEKDDDGRVFQAVRLFVRNEVDTSGLPKNLRFKSRRTIENIVRILQADQRMIVRFSEWDPHRDFINTPSGEVNLHTGETFPHNPTHLHPAITSVAPKLCDHPHFSAFLETFTDGDPEKQEFLQRWFGYVATTYTKEHQFIFFLGPGGNGKSVLFEIISRALGTYALKAGAGTFLDDRHLEHAHAIARLMLARMVYSEENEADCYLKSAMLKEFTGGTKMATRELRQATFEAQPRAKLNFSGNHPPQYRGIDEAMRRRQILFRCESVVPLEKRDKDLLKKLQDELPAIVNWIIEGAKLYLQSGLKIPQSVINDTAAYFDDLDSFKMWFDNHCNTQDVTERTKRSVAYSHYHHHCISDGLQPISRQAFNFKMKQKGVQDIKSGERFFIGLKLV